MSKWLQGEESHVPPSNVGREDLEKYRAKWTSDVPASRTMRFQTESRRATVHAPLKFQMPSLRLLPGTTLCLTCRLVAIIQSCLKLTGPTLSNDKMIGTPRPLERFRERLLEKYGILGLAVVRFYVGVGDISIEDLRTAVKKMDVSLDRFELNQIAAYFTQTQIMSADKFIRFVVARTDGFEEMKPTPDELYDRLLSDSPAGPTIEALLEKMNAEIHPEFVQGFSQYLSVYAQAEPGFIGREEFRLILTDFYASAPLEYNEIIGSLFLL
jgi:hypothetical protein